MQWGPLHRKGTLLSTSTLDRKWKKAILPGSAPWASTARWRMPSCRTSWTRRRTSWGGPRPNSGSTSRTTSDHRWGQLLSTQAYLYYLHYLYTHIAYLRMYLIYLKHIYDIYIIYTSIFILLVHICISNKSISILSTSSILSYLHYIIYTSRWRWSRCRRR